MTLMELVCCCGCWRGQLWDFWQKLEFSIVKHMVKLCQSVCGKLPLPPKPALLWLLRFTIIKSRHVTHLEEQSLKRLSENVRLGHKLGSEQDYTGIHLAPVLRKMVSFNNIMISPRFPHSGSHNTGHTLVYITSRSFSLSVCYLLKKSWKVVSFYSVKTKITNGKTWGWPVRSHRGRLPAQHRTSLSPPPWCPRWKQMYSDTI